LFVHRLAQFDSKMKAAELAWQSGTVPDAPLAFDTALILFRPK
jgi:hypothetical protein